MRFYLAISSLVGFGTELPSDGRSKPFNRLSDVIDILGLPDDYSRGSIKWIELPQDRALESTDAEEALEYIDSHLEQLNNRSTILLEQISPRFRTTWIRPDSKEHVEIDYADSLALLAYLKLIQAEAAIFEAYNLEFDAKRIVDLNTDDNDLNNETVESFLSKNPAFMSIKARSHLNRAKNLLLDGVIKNIEQAIRSIEGESDPQDDDLLKISSADREDISRTRSYLSKTRNSIINGETLVHEDSDGDRTKNLVLNLKRFFVEGVDFRKDDLLPAVKGNRLDESRPCLPDPTFNGVVISPNLDDVIYEEFPCN